MIVLAPQLDDWGHTSAERTIELVEHFLNAYDVDPARVYIEGYSGGGETLSLVMEFRPELFAAALAVSSQWDGALEPVAHARTPLYLFIGREDSYYGSDSFVAVAAELRKRYRTDGLSEEEAGELIVLDVKDAAYFAERGYSDQHAGGGAAATDAEVMEWLFTR
ncbi:MAG: prolyl oligopeptidase family serine peptidase [Coriobacteriia bacterium]|nr:prolyl oligopeptidase family serine peptidase [Coriobacteriia bacterium]